MIFIRYISFAVALVCAIVDAHLLLSSPSKSGFDPDSTPGSKTLDRTIYENLKTLMKDRKITYSKRHSWESSEENERMKKALGMFTRGFPSRFPKSVGGEYKTNNVYHPYLRDKYGGSTRFSYDRPRPLRWG